MVAGERERETQLLEQCCSTALQISEAEVCTTMLSLSQCVVCIAPWGPGVV